MAEELDKHVAAGSAPLAGDTHSRWMDDLRTTHQASLKRDTGDIANDQTWITADQKGLETAQKIIDNGGQLLNMLDSGVLLNSNQAKPLADSLLHLHATMTGLNNADRAGDLSAIAKDDKDAKGEQRVIDADTAALKNVTDPAMRELLNQDTGLKTNLIANELGDKQNEQNYALHDQADNDTNRRVIAALKSGNADELRAALHDSIASKQTIIGDRTEDLGLEPRYVAADRADLTLNQPLLDILGSRKKK